MTKRAFKQWRAVPHPDRKGLFAVQHTCEPGSPSDAAWLYVLSRDIKGRNGGYKVREYSTEEKAELDAEDRRFWYYGE